MIRDIPWLGYRSGFEWELTQAGEEGRAVSQMIRDGFENLLKMDEATPDAAELYRFFYDTIQKLPYREDAPKEPSDWEGICAEMGKMPELAKPDDNLYDRIYGAWLARCAGCLLGQPIEGWKSERIIGLLKATENYPVKHYISSDIDPEIRERFGVTDDRCAYGATKTGWINNVDCMPEDDDTNYMVLALILMERKGLDFTPDDAAQNWMNNLPILHACTAERVAYRNFVMSIEPPESASFCNPYREWIGAQIRGDVFGYAAAGDPMKGAHMAYNDACISHVKNGIYGEMWVAAMLAAAAVTDDLDTVIQAGLAAIPQKSRLHSSLQEVLDWKASGKTCEEVIAFIRERYDENNGHHWCHTISNAMIVLTALIYGGLDLGKTLGIAVTPGFDTDCNGATSGSIVGMLKGAKALPAEWIDPLNDGLISGVDGFGRVKLSDLAARTAALNRKENT